MEIFIDYPLSYWASNVNIVSSRARRHPETPRARMNHLCSSIIAAAISLFACAATQTASGPYSLEAFPSEVAPVTMDGDTKVFHQEDFSKPPLKKHWGTREKATEVADGFLKTHRTTDGGGKYKISVEPFRNAEFHFRFRLHNATGFWFGTDDLTIKDTIYGGHLFSVAITTKSLGFKDSISGIYNPEHYPKFKKARNDRKTGKRKKLPQELQDILDATTRDIPQKLEQERWYQTKIVLKDDVLTVFLDGKEAGSYQSHGFAHPRKDMYRFIMQGDIDIDDMKAIATK